MSNHLVLKILGVLISQADPELTSTIVISIELSAWVTSFKSEHELFNHRSTPEKPEVSILVMGEHLTSGQT